MLTTPTLTLFHIAIVIMTDSDTLLGIINCSRVCNNRV
jgi:hypothetical protein